MGQRKLVFTFSCLVVFVLFVFYPAYASQTGKIAAGDGLPAFTLDGPDSVEAQKYLGLENRDPFSISQIPSKLVIIDVISAL
ncbi:MAG: hypothetical protein PVG99_08595 [Desulfobacteraceae bacterium]|jgi:hypothetical protein